jgi:copper chaperone CopZ
MQLTLYAPDVTCDHCIATIKTAVDTVEGATFLSGDPDSKSFVVELASGAILDQLAAATEAEGYPLGEAAPAEMQHGEGHHGGDTATTWVPTYTVTATDKGADINYACPCGCTAGFALDRAVADQHAEGCCRGKQLLVAPANAEDRLRAGLNGGEYRLDVQQITMPWGQPMQAAIAIPVEG